MAPEQVGTPLPARLGDAWIEVVLGLCRRRGGCGCRKGPDDDLCNLVELARSRTRVWSAPEFPSLMPEVYHAPFASARHRVAVRHDACVEKRGLCLAARKPEARGDVHENEVVVRPTAYEARTPAQKPFGERPGVGDYRRRVRGERYGAALLRGRPPSQPSREEAAPRAPSGNPCPRKGRTHPCRARDHRADHEGTCAWSRSRHRHAGSGRGHPSGLFPPRGPRSEPCRP